MNRMTRNITASATLFAAAMTGMLAGCMSHSGTDSGSAAVSGDLSKHGCKGQNQCKGYGGCKTGNNGCKGQNSCKGQGWTEMSSKADCDAAKAKAKSS